MRAAEVAAPGVPMSIELDERDRSKVSVDRPQDRQEDGMIAPDADRPRTGAKHVAQLIGYAAIGVFNRERVDGEIAKISDTPLFERIDLQHRIPGADHGRLHANVARAETRTGAVGGASVEGNTNQGKVEVLGSRNVRQPHECGDAGETWVDQRVH